MPSSMSAPETELIVAGGLLHAVGVLNRALSVEVATEQLKRLLSPTTLWTIRSSIAFILEYRGARMLLGADAHPATLVSGLKRFAKMKGESRVKLDLFKLPHHGSRANVTTKLIELVDTSCYLISTDGMNFGHPDDAAIARVLRSSKAPVEIYCNYASDRTVGWISRADARGSKVIVPEDGASSMRVEVL